MVIPQVRGSPKPIHIISSGYLRPGELDAGPTYHLLSNMSNYWDPNTLYTTYSDTGKSTSLSRMKAPTPRINVFPLPFQIQPIPDQDSRTDRKIPPIKMQAPNFYL